MVVAAVERTMRPTDEDVSDGPCVDDDAFGVVPLGCFVVARTLYKYMHRGTLPWFDYRTQTIAPTEIDSDLDKEGGHMICMLVRVGRG